jgi:hypothetical protein
MKIDITAEQAKTNTQAYAAIVKKLGSADGIKWRYDWCQCIQSTPVQDIFSGKAHADAERERNKDIETRLSDIEKNVGCDLYGSLGRKRHRVSIDKVPTEVMDVYRKSLEEEIAERKRFDALTDEEKNAETRKLIEELQGMRGFMSFQVKRK